MSEVFWKVPDQLSLQLTVKAGATPTPNTRGTRRTVELGATNSQNYKK